jgi:hypothetical protein
MKIFKVISVAIVLIVSASFLTPANADSTPTLTKSGVTLSFRDPIYTLTSSASVIAYYENKSGFTLGSLRYEVTDKFGTLAGQSPGAYNVKDATSGTLVTTWFPFEFEKTSAPYSISLIFSYQFGSGKSDEIVTVPFEFTPRSTVTPTPTPTVTVFSTPSPGPTVYITNPSDKTLSELVNSLRKQVSLLNAKLKKICAVKPKPKGC